MVLKRGLDAIYTFRFIKTLVLSWKKTDAYKLGLVDEKGKKLRSPETSEEKNAYTFFHRVVFNIKRLMELVPGNIGTKLASYAAAYKLLKEEDGLEQDEFIDLIERITKKKFVITESSNPPLILGNYYILNKELPMKFTDAEPGQSVQVVEEAELFAGVKTYKAIHQLSEQEVIITNEDVSFSVATGDVAQAPKPLKMDDGTPYQRFKVKTSFFNKIKERSKYERWSKYIDEDDEELVKMKEFAKKYSNAAIELEDASTGARRVIYPQK